MNLTPRTQALLLALILGAPSLSHGDQDRRPQASASSAAPGGAQSANDDDDDDDDDNEPSVRPAPSKKPYLAKVKELIRKRQGVERAREIREFTAEIGKLGASPTKDQVHKLAQKTAQEYPILAYRVAAAHHLALGREPGAPLATKRTAAITKELRTAAERAHGKAPAGNVEAVLRQVPNEVLYEDAAGTPKPRTKEQRAEKVNALKEDVRKRSNTGEILDMMRTAKERAQPTSAARSGKDLSGASTTTSGGASGGGAKGGTSRGANGGGGASGGGGGGSSGETLTTDKYGVVRSSSPNPQGMGYPNTPLGRAAADAASRLGAHQALVDAGQGPFPDFEMGRLEQELGEAQGKLLDSQGRHLEAELVRNSANLMGGGKGPNSFMSNLAEEMAGDYVKGGGTPSKATGPTDRDRQGPGNNGGAVPTGPTDRDRQGPGNNGASQPSGKAPTGPTDRDRQGPGNNGASQPSGKTPTGPTDRDRQGPGNNGGSSASGSSGGSKSSGSTDRDRQGPGNNGGSSSSSGSKSGSTSGGSKSGGSTGATGPSDRDRQGPGNNGGSSSSSSGSKSGSSSGGSKSSGSSGSTDRDRQGPGNNGGSSSSSSGSKSGSSGSKSSGGSSSKSSDSGARR